MSATATPPRVAFVSPFTNSTNRYIELHKQLLADTGYAVRPLNLRTLLSKDAFGLLSARNLVTVHWLETRAFRHRGAHQGLWLRGAVEFMLYAAVLALARARRVVFVHDHAVHDTTGWQRRVSAGLIRLLRALADERVVHDPASTARYGATYLPHPLYWDAPDTALAPAPAAPAGAAAPLRFGLLGAVRPYKRIEHILRVWPEGVPLRVRGRAEPAYAAQLRAVVAQRQLAPAVDFVPGQLSDADFDAAMAAIDVLILPHADESMLVSGAFFEAAGRVPVILARDSPFIRWAAARLPGVVAFTDDAALAEAVRRLAAEPAGGRGKAAFSRQAALALFGWAECRRRYGALLGEPRQGWMPA